MYEALYLHIPFCRKRCAYCDFTTEALPPDDPAMDAYLAALMSEIRQAAKRGELAAIRTIYLGGGTPTHLGHARLVELAYLLALNLKVEKVEEYTLEANPESLTAKMVNDLFALGVNRLSLGVQSFVDSELETLGRIHDAAAAIRAAGEARARFENISLDLMCGIPGQTTASWQYSLEQALALNPEHLSIYPLQIEEGTELGQRDGAWCPNLLSRANWGTKPRPSAPQLPDEDEQAEFMEQAARFLQAHGYHRYEVASYAKPGFESKHNTAYWQGTPYLGLGTAAASMSNLPDGTRQRSKNGEEPEFLTAEEACAEDLFLAMRMARGICEEQLKQASKLLPRAQEVFSELEQLELISHQDGRYLPTDKGWLLGNELYGRIWQLAGMI